MRIASAIIQNRNITRSTPNDFNATYKGREINITTNHGNGKPQHPDYIRYDIVVTYLGSYEVNTWQDLFSMHEAIEYALKGACLMP
jgi:hypothetical protein